MIITGFLYMVYGVIWLLIEPFRILPDASLPSNIASAITTANTYLVSINSFVPVSTILTIVALTLVVEGFILSWKLINWVIKKIPTIS